MRKTIILFLAVLLSVGAYAADNNTTAGSDSQALTKKEQRRTLRRYKGFVEIGIILDGAATLGMEDERGHHFDVLTSHGFQFNNFVYLGGGTGVFAYPQFGILAPVFGNLRINMLNGHISPVLDLKGGYSLGRFYGGFWSVDIGIRIGLEKKSAMYVMLGCMFQNDANPTVHWHDKWSNYVDDWTNGGFGLRVGYEF